MQPSRIFALAFAAMACATARAAEPSVEWIPYHAEDPKLWGTPSLVVRPDYPKAALARRKTGNVDIEGVIQGTGTLKDILLTPDSAEAAVFVEALEPLVPHWQFHPPIGNDCQPTSETVSMRVSFELDAGEPRIFVLPSKSYAQAGWQLPAHLNMLHGETPAYPASMRNLGWEARVYAKQEIDPSGKVTDVKASVYSKFAGPVARGDVLEFEKEAQRALMLWKFPPAPPLQSVPRFLCQEVIFQLAPRGK